MLELFHILLSSQLFIPQGNCYLWEPHLVGLHGASDSLIALAYYAIALLLFYFVSQRRDLPFQRVFWMFGAFIIACGTTHLLEVWTLWHPVYWLSGSIKAITAAISLYTALKLVPLIPQALALPSPALLETANLALSREIAECQRAEVPLKAANEQLEIRIEERTAQLKQLADRLTIEIAQRHQVQEALLESEALLQNMLNNLPVGVWVADKQGRIYQGNLEARRIWGGAKYVDLERQDQYKGWWADTGKRIESHEWGLARAIAKGETSLNEVIEIEGFDGKRKTILNSAIPLRNAQQEIIGAIAVNQDVTQYQLVEKAFWDNQRLIQQVAEATPAILYIYDLSEQRNIYVNRQVSQILGYSPEDVQQMGSWLVPTTLHPDDWVKVTETIQRFATLGEGEIVETEYRMRHANGEWRWLYSRETVFTRTADGLPQQILGTATDMTVRKQTEKALQESEQQLRAVFESAMDAMAIADDNGQYVAVNPAAVELFGLTREELIGRCIADFAEGNFDFSQAWQNFLETGRERGEFRIVRPDGIKRDVEYAAIASFLPNRHLSVMRDITSRKRSESQLSEYRDRLEQIVQVRTGELRIANKLLQAEISERQQVEEALRESQEVLRQQVQRERLIAAIAQHIRQTLDINVILGTTVAEVRQFLQVDRVLVYRIWPDGSGSTIAEAVVPCCPAILGITFPVEVFPQEFHQLYCQGRIRAVVDPENEGLTPCLVEFLHQLGVKSKLVVPILQGEKLWGLLIAHQTSQNRQWQHLEIDLLKQLAIQVTIAIQQAELYRQIQNELADRKKAEAALRESEVGFRKIFADAPIGMALFDGDGQLRLVNRALCNMLGYTESELKALTFWKITNPDDLEKERPYVEQCVKGEISSYQIEKRFLKKNGGSLLTHLTCGAIRHPIRKIQYELAMIEDITQRKQVEQMKDEFISIVSHELRTPLTSLRGALGLLSTGRLGVLTEQGQRLLEFAVADTDRLTRLVNDILDLERLKSGKMTLNRQICDAAGLMQRVVNNMQLSAQKSGITLSFVPVSVEVWADGDRIIQVLTNLLGNALKFSPEGSIVCLSVQGQGDRALFQVKDQGRGIPAEQLETIFEPFKQVDTSDSRQKGGTGLGLAICRSIVQQHGGRIWAESTLGQGSTFCFTLPVRQEG